MEFTVEQARKHADFTQQQMADKMGISRHTYIRIEKEPESATIGQGKAIARITGIPFNQIFFGENSTLSRE